MSNDSADIIIQYFLYQWGYALATVAILMFLFYLVYLVIRNPGLVDFAWECSHVAVGLLFYILNKDVLHQRSLTFLVLLLCWFIRLGGYILVTRIFAGEKDPRYEKLSQEKNPYVFFFFNYQLQVNFSFINQGVLVILVSAPLYFVFRAAISEEITWSYYVGVVMISIGIIFEGIADYQLYSYKERRKKERETEARLREDQPRKIFQEGLWRKSRHPNLFFELVTWFGFAFAGISEPITIVGFIGPICLYLIMRFLTVPITENHMRDTRPEYAEFCKETNMFFIL